MVTSVSNQVNNQQKTNRVSIFYINDVHANAAGIERLKSASDQFDAFVPSEKTDKLKLSAGDFSLGGNKKLNGLAVAAQNVLGLMATAGGNHEFDPLKESLADVLAENKYKMLGINVKIPQTSEGNKRLTEELQGSYVQEVNGNKYAIIGLLPLDFHLHVTNDEEYGDFEIMPFDETVSTLQSEVDKYKKQGIDKVIVLSHAGYNEDIKLAQAVEGIDVIIGGHTHDLLKDIKEGKNLFYSKKTGEPTIITQAGKEGKYFGVLNLEFNDKGVITSAQNNVTPTKEYPKNPVMKFLSDFYLGKPKVIGVINSSTYTGATLVKENPNADFVADAERIELGTDIAIMNSGNMRKGFKPGPITDRQISETTPFKNTMCIIKLSEKEVVDAIKTGAKSLTDKDNMPGLLQVSGLRYTITKDGELKQASFIDKDGKENPIDVNNPNPFKTYRAAMDVFVAMGGNNYIPDKWNESEAKFNFDKDKLVIDYMQRLNKPIDIKEDGRIKIVDN